MEKKLERLQTALSKITPKRGASVIALEEASRLVSRFVTNREQAQKLLAQLRVEGVIVVRTVPGSPADRAGLRGVDRMTGAVGDVIVAANGKSIQRLADLTEQLEQIGVGQTIRLTVKRGSGTITVSAVVADITPAR